MQFTIRSGFGLVNGYVDVVVWSAFSLREGLSDSADGLVVEVVGEFFPHQAFTSGHDVAQEHEAECALHVIAFIA
ncbi:MAG: hypothetical protein SPI77_00765, partial [Corynebacterium sp.]|nr:hypothetical protein [Corynebacterium sp.]